MERVYGVPRQDSHWPSIHRAHADQPVLNRRWATRREDQYLAWLLDLSAAAAAAGDPGEWRATFLRGPNYCAPSFHLSG